MTSGHSDRRDSRTARWRARAILAAPAAVLAVVAPAAACSGGDDAEPLGSRRGRPGLAQPAGGDVEALEPVLVDLLERYDEVVGEVLADPGVARDEDDPLIQEFVSLYSPDSEAPEATVDAWVRDAEAGRQTHPVATGYPAIASRIDGEIETVSDDEVRFPTCNELRYATYDADGDMVDFIPYLEQPGEATAVRVDGQWLLQQLVAFEGQASCRARESTEEPS
jgi:hypothetical protein